MIFRDLTADEIEIRVASVNENGVQLLLYKNARVDMSILDETVGSENWQREHYECKGNLFCRVGINTNYNKPDLPDHWIWKSDCGAERNTEAEKGEASDSFKRACTNWGIGRELYTSPFIWIDANDVNITKGNNGKLTCRERFYLRDIKIENKKITALEIVNRQNKVVFSKGYSQSKKSAQTIDETKLKALCALAKEKKVTATQICKKYGVKKVEDLNDEQIADCMVQLYATN